MNYITPPPWLITPLLRNGECKFDAKLSEHLWGLLHLCTVRAHLVERDRGNMFVVESCWTTLNIQNASQRRWFNLPPLAQRPWILFPWRGRRSRKEAPKHPKQRWSPRVRRRGAPQKRLEPRSGTLMRVRVQVSCECLGTRS